MSTPTTDPRIEEVSRRRHFDREPRIEHEDVRYVLAAADAVDPARLVLTQLREQWAEVKRLRGAGDQAEADAFARLAALLDSVGGNTP